MQGIPDSHPHIITSTKCRINTVVSPDDEHIAARNMHRKEINILRRTVHPVGFIYKILYSLYPFNKTVDGHQSRCRYFSFSVPSESSAAATSSCFLSCDFPDVEKETATSFFNITSLFLDAS